MKANQQLFDHGTFLAENGIATIIGIPLTDTLDQLTQDTPSRWFELDNDGTEFILHNYKQAALVEKGNRYYTTWNQQASWNRLNADKSVTIGLK